MELGFVHMYLLQVVDTEMTINCNTVPQKFYPSEVLCEIWQL